MPVIILLSGLPIFKAPIIYYNFSPVIFSISLIIYWDLAAISGYTVPSNTYYLVSLISPPEEFFSFSPILYLSIPNICFL